MAITLLVVDEHELIRGGLRRAFEGEGDCDVIGEAATIAEATRLITLLSPQIIVLEAQLPDGSGIEAGRKLRSQVPDLGIVILTGKSNDERLFRALDAGASAFVTKSSPVDDVVAAVRHAAVSPHTFTASDLAEAMKRRLSPSGPQLSPREREVLQLLADGLSVAQISRDLFISESTTKTHISKLYEKLGAGNRAQALMSALRLGLLRQSADQD
ncbi:MAG: response regulator [Candidatus Nanopelagicales bacterium]